MKNVILLLVVAMTLVAVTDVFAQTQPSEIPECVQFGEEVGKLTEQAAQLPKIFPEKPKDTEALMKGMVEGGALMEQYGNALKGLSNQLEVPCKTKLAEGDNKDAIVTTVYQPLLPIVTNTYDFLSNIKTYAEDLGEGQFATKMQEIIDTYAADMRKLAEMCPKEVSDETCKPFVDELTAKLK